ncbi:hypothetical protein EGW08_007894, partial [Elysia chlorotica]
ASASATYSKRAAQLLSSSIPLSGLLEDLAEVNEEEEEEDSSDFSSEESEGFTGEEDEEEGKWHMGSKHFSRGEGIKLYAKGASSSDSEGDTRKSYLNRLVWLCFRGFQKTSSMMRSIPVASRLLQTISPKCLGEVEGFLEALLLEMVSNRYTVLDGGFFKSTEDKLYNCFPLH